MRSQWRRRGGLDDQLGEYWAEFFLAVLDQPTGGVRFADPAVALVGISENDVAVEFDPASCRVNETNGSVSLSIWRRGIDSGPLTVHYFTRGDSAVEGEDFVAQSGSITFPAASHSGNYTNRIITIAILLVITVSVVAYSVFRTPEAATGPIQAIPLNPETSASAETTALTTAAAPTVTRSSWGARPK